MAVGVRAHHVRVSDDPVAQHPPSRGRHPLGARATVYYPLGFPDGLVTLCAFVMLYTVVQWGYRRVGWSLGLGQFIALNLWELTWVGEVRPEAIGVIVWVLVVLCVAEVMRTRAEYRRADPRRRTEAVRTREEGLLRRASEARLHLARDVHDTVAHNISLINVQASTALYLMDREPERASEALATIKQTSKDTLNELRSTLDVLRAANTGRAPSPGPRPGAGGGTGGEHPQCRDRRALRGTRDATPPACGDHHRRLQGRPGGPHQRGAARGRLDRVDTRGIPARGSARTDHRQRPHDERWRTPRPRNDRHG